MQISLRSAAHRSANFIVFFQSCQTKTIPLWIHLLVAVSSGIGHSLVPAHRASCSLQSHIQSRQNWLICCAAGWQLQLDTAQGSSGSCGYTCGKAAFPLLSRALKYCPYSKLCSEAEEGLWHRGKKSSPHAALLTAILGAHAKANAAWRLCTRAPAVASPPSCIFFGTSSWRARGTLQWQLH